MAYHLSCPSCETKLPVPETALNETPRAVKCNRCAHVWKAVLYDVDEYQQQEETAPDDMLQDDALLAETQAAEGMQEPEPEYAQAPAETDMQAQDELGATQEMANNNDAMMEGSVDDSLPSLDDHDPFGEDNGFDDLQSYNDSNNNNFDTPDEAVKDAFDDALLPLQDNTAQDNMGMQNMPVDELQAQDHDREVAEDLAHALEHHKEMMDAAHEEELSAAAKGPQVEPLIKGKAILILWGGFVLLLISLLGGFFVGGKALTSAYPHTAVVYDFFGIEYSPIGTGLEISELVVDKKDTADGVQIDVAGKIINRTEETLPVPILRISLKNRFGAELKQWYKELVIDELQALSELEYTEQIIDVPLGSTEISIVFVSEAERDSGF